MLFGLNHNAVSEIPPAAYTQKELTMMGSLGKDFPASISLIESGIDLTSFVTHRIGLDEINEAVELLNNKKACRVIVYPNGKE